MEGVFIGRRIPKINAAALSTGQAKFVDDLVLPQMLFGRMLVSPYPHAKILNIDTSKAEQLPGVKAVITSRGMPDVTFGRFISDERPLAKDKVRYIGDPVAAVAAADDDRALEAVSLIKVDYQELSAVFDPIEAMKPDAPKIHEAENNIAVSSRIHAGDLEQGFKEADYIFEDTFVTSRVQHCYLEPIGTLALFESGKLTIWPTTQVPFRIRAVLAKFFGLSLHNVRVIESYLGGSFGGKADPFHIDFCATALSMKTGRPVKIIFSREDEFENTRTRLGEVIHLKTGVKRGGTMVARQADVICDNGAYCGSSPGNAYWGGLMFGALYRIPNMKFEWHLVYTNLVQAGSMRGFGNPQITFAGESQIDKIAKELGIDSMDFRLKNAVQINDKTPFGMVLGSCGLTECIHQAADRVQWRKKKKRKPSYRGIGMACMVHCSGARLSPSMDADFSSARVRVNDDGTVNLAIGTGDMGTGSDTIMAQIVAEELGIRIEDVQVLSGDTDATPQCMGAGASRFTVICGNAVREAAGEVKQQLFETIAEKLGVDVENLVARDRNVFVKGSPEKRISISEAVRACIYRRGGKSVVSETLYDGKGFVPNRETGCGDVSTSYPFACQVAEVEVDPETGKAQILKFVAAHDAGRIINPMLAEGQVEGGVAMGIGYALTEELLYKDGKLLNNTFLDYKIPGALDMPPIETIFVETNDPRGPFGAKGLAEPCVIPTAPAIVNAIYDAIDVQITSLPITPEKILKALREKEKKVDDS